MNAPSYLPQTEADDQQKNFLISSVIIVFAALAVLAFFLRSILRTPIVQHIQPTQPFTNEQKVQIFKKFSSGSTSTPQSSDQQKVRTLQNLSQPQATSTQPFFIYALFLA